jgi:hypothetical protein
LDSSGDEGEELLGREEEAGDDRLVGAGWMAGNLMAAPPADGGAGDVVLSRDDAAEAVADVVEKEGRVNGMKGREEEEEEDDDDEDDDDAEGSFMRSGGRVRDGGEEADPGAIEGSRRARVARFWDSGPRPPAGVGGRGGRPRARSTPASPPEDAADEEPEPAKAESCGRAEVERDLTSGARERSGGCDDEVEVEEAEDVDDDGGTLDSFSRGWCPPSSLRGGEGAISTGPWPGGASLPWLRWLLLSPGPKVVTPADDDDVLLLDVPSWLPA